MKTLSIIILLSLSTSQSVTSAQEPADDEWKLVWSDEFDGKELDFTKWAVEEHGHGGGNNELQYYVDRPENVRVEDGNLILEARKEEYSNTGITKEYTSGKVRTKRRASWKYGRFEIKAILPKGRGIWPAIWLLPDKETYGGWASSGEIDIMELVGHEPNKVHGTLHHGGSWPRNIHHGKPFELKESEGDFSGKPHVFTLEWEEGVIRWFVDGQLYQTQTEWKSEGAPFPAPFNQPFHFILNLAVGGQWPGNPDATTTFPQRMTVDYIRVYQKQSGTD